MESLPTAPYRVTPRMSGVEGAFIFFLLQFFLLQYLRDRPTFLTSTYPWERPIF